MTILNYVVSFEYICKMRKIYNIFGITVCRVQVISDKRENHLCFYKAFTEFSFGSQLIEKRKRVTTI